MFNGTTTYEGLIKEAAAPLYLLSNVSTHTHTLHSFKVGASKLLEHFRHYSPTSI